MIACRGSQRLFRSWAYATTLQRWGRRRWRRRRVQRRRRGHSPRTRHRWRRLCPGRSCDLRQPAKFIRMLWRYYVHRKVIQTSTWDKCRRLQFPICDVIWFVKFSRFGQKDLTNRGERKRKLTQIIVRFRHLRSLGQSLQYIHNYHKCSFYLFTRVFKLSRGDGSSWKKERDNTSYTTLTILWHSDFDVCNTQMIMVEVPQGGKCQKGLVPEPKCSRIRGHQWFLLLFTKKLPMF